MTTKTIRGALETGLGCAKEWSIGEIRKVTGFPSLQPGTLNVRLDAPHNIRTDALLLREGRIDNLDEDLLFERCQLLLGGVTIPAWIVRTSRNFHGDHVLEIMAEERLRQRYGLKDDDYICVQVFLE
jgi:CTP-dependent riboflavin kinase